MRLKMSEERAWGLGYALIALELYDVLITRWGLGLGLCEANGFAASLIETHGFVFVGAIKLAMAMLFVLVMMLLYHRKNEYVKKAGYYGLLTAFMFMLIVCLRNWLLMAEVVL